MFDAIQQAIGKAKALSNNVKQTSVELVNTQIPTFPKLPKIKDPILLAKQKEAEAQKQVSEIKNKLLINKEESFKKIKLASNLGALPVIKFPKLPLLDKKVIQSITIAKQCKNLITERTKTSIENLKKSKEAFTYPLIPKAPTLKLPKVPDLPIISKLSKF